MIGAVDLAHDGRFAPSPTGALHLGNLRTALIAWLFARSAGARFTLRVEDLDPQRSRPEHERAQLADLRALGIDWDCEAPRQSQRTQRYRDAIAQLQRDGRVYPCWCTRAEIRAAASAPHGPLPEGAYPGTCRDLTAAQRAQREREADRAPALRLDARGEVERFEDGVLGSAGGPVDDIVLQRSDATPAYNLAVIVDDADQGVAEVVRGDDLLETTPRQLLIARLLGLTAPRYAHVPLVLGPDGERLAKRHGAITLSRLAARGDRPESARAWMARSLGLAEEGEEPSAPELVERFDRHRLPREATVLDPGRLTRS